MSVQKLSLKVVTAVFVYCLHYTLSAFCPAVYAVVSDTTVSFINEVVVIEMAVEVIIMIDM